MATAIKTKSEWFYYVDNEKRTKRQYEKKNSLKLSTKLESRESKLIRSNGMITISAE